MPINPIIDIKKEHINDILDGQVNFTIVYEVH
jgi:hypothetical protein